MFSISVVASCSNFCKSLSSSSISSSFLPRSPHELCFPGCVLAFFERFLSDFTRRELLSAAVFLVHASLSATDVQVVHPSPPPPCQAAAPRGTCKCFACTCVGTQRKRQTLLAKLTTFSQRPWTGRLTGVAPGEIDPHPSTPLCYSAACSRGVSFSPSLSGPEGRPCFFVSRSRGVVSVVLGASSACGFCMGLACGGKHRPRRGQRNTWG